MSGCEHMEDSYYTKEAATNIIWTNMLYKPLMQKYSSLESSFLFKWVKAVDDDKYLLLPLLLFLLDNKRHFSQMNQPTQIEKRKRDQEKQKFE